VELKQIADTAANDTRRNEAIDHCLAGIAKLSNEVKDASGYIPPYDQRTYSEVSFTHVPSICNPKKWDRRSNP
jgi:hypothetical protein